ncbi:hepatoma-derived growth factor-like [Drosophila innubila]|uniref:hepatoma-derived growth factor-like n=1 Tax=Drosophila innubila TaxID=198719 RepID=UPI00148D0021|nr:hepatoma-derived growth factor-like [Drosophila innubila]
MSLTKANPLKKGDFVFAKMKGYPAWPGRILQSVGGMHNVFFYGTCNTAMVADKHISPYELWKRNLVDPKKLQQKEFKRAMMHAELMIANPTEDRAYYYFLAKVPKDYTQADVIDLDRGDEYDMDDNDNDNDVNNCD